MRQFDTGATRDKDDNKLDYEGFLCPLVLERYAQYMHKNRRQADGNFRASDNWQKGIPQTAYMKSMWRHFHAVWKGYRYDQLSDDDLCAIMFNSMGILHERLKAEPEQRSSVKERLMDNAKGIPHEHLRKLSEMVETPKER